MSQSSPLPEPPPLPQTIEACHSLICRLREELAQTRQSLAIHEENQRREWERIYGRGATPQSLLNIGLLMAGKGGVVHSKDPGDPTCGELLARRRAAEREDRKRQRQSRKQDDQRPGPG
jgi:hypothetical protein